MLSKQQVIKMMCGIGGFAVVSVTSGCAGGEASSFELSLLDSSRLSGFDPLRSYPVSLASIEDGCIVSAYSLKATGSDGIDLFSRVEEVVPDLSKVDLTQGDPELGELIAGFDFKTTFQIVNPKSDPVLDSVDISFQGVIKVCEDVWGGGGKVSVVTSVFYGSTNVNLNAFQPSSSDTCGGSTNCIAVDSYVTTLYPIRSTDKITDFLANQDLKDFVPVIFNHLNTDCEDNIEGKSGRNHILVKATINGLDSPISSDFYGSSDDKYHFVSQSRINESEDDDYKTILLASLIVGQKYEVTFTEGTGTGCEEGKAVTKSIEIGRDEVFDSSGARVNASVTMDVNW